MKGDEGVHERIILERILTLDVNWITWLGIGSIGKPVTRCCKRREVSWLAELLLASKDSALSSLAASPVLVPTSSLPHCISVMAGRVLLLAYCTCNVDMCI